MYEYKYIIRASHSDYYQIRILIESIDCKIRAQCTIRGSKDFNSFGGKCSINHHCVTWASTSMLCVCVELDWANVCNVQHICKCVLCLVQQYCQYGQTVCERIHLCCQPASSLHNCTNTKHKRQLHKTQKTVAHTACWHCRYIETQPASALRAQ